MLREVQLEEAERQRQPEESLEKCSKKDDSRYPTSCTTRLVLKSSKKSVFCAVRVFCTTRTCRASFASPGPEQQSNAVSAGLGGGQVLFRQGVQRVEHHKTSMQMEKTKLLGAPGLTTTSKKLLATKGIATFTEQRQTFRTFSSVGAFAPGTSHLSSAGRTYTYSGAAPKQWKVWSHSHVAGSVPTL